MPRAFDRRPPPPNDHDPLRGQLDFGNPETFLGAPFDFLTGFKDLLVSAIKGLTGLDLSSPTAFIASFVALAGGAFGGLGTSGGFGGLIGKALGGLLPKFLTIGALSNNSVNQLPPEAATFPAGSIAANPRWTVDMTTSRTSDGTGSARIVADGNPHALRSGADPFDTIPVTAGVPYTPSINVIYQGYAGVGAAIQLHVVPYTEAGPLAPVFVAAHTPTGPNMAWPGFKLSGDYVPPVGVIGVQQRFYVDPAATAGEIHFDDAGSAQTGKIQKSWIEGLTGDLDNIGARQQLLIDTMLGVFRGVPVVGGEIADIGDALLSIPARIVGGIGGAANMGDTNQNVIDNLVGGLLGKVVSGAGFADIFSAAKHVASQSTGVTVDGTDGTDVTHYLIDSQTIDIPSWANYVDAVALGGGGAGGGALDGIGENGTPGVFNVTTWKRATHYTGATTITFTRAAGGVGGFGDGGDGGDSTLAIPGFSIVAAGGVGGTHPKTAAVPAPGPGTYVYNDDPYPGGGQQTARGGAGATPGGAGAGGSLLSFVLKGGNGARGAGWVRFRKDPLPGETTGTGTGDTTPPTAPTTITLIAATPNSLTVTISGGSD